MRRTYSHRGKPDAFRDRVAARKKAMRRQRFLAAVFAALCCAALAAATIFPYLGAKADFAYADTHKLDKPADSYYITQTIDGLPYYLGAIARDSQGRNTYCIETGVHEQYSYTSSTPLSDTPDTRRIAYLAEKYRNEPDRITHAAIAALIKDRFEARDKGLWTYRRGHFLKEHPEIPVRMEQLWAEAEAADISTFSVKNSYTEARRRGVFHAQVLDTHGKAVAGVRMDITLNGPGEFDSVHSRTITVTSRDEPVDIAWTATGDGEVSVEARSRVGSLDRLDSRQDYLRTGAGVEAVFRGITFEVQKTFQPSVHTVAESRTVNEGGHIIDNVTSGVSAGQWPSGAELKADGYYFAGLTQDDLKNGIRPSAGMSADGFMRQIAARGYKPSAYGHTSFTGSGQTHAVTAMAGPDPAAAQPYTVKRNSGFGTWVWAIRKSAQDKDVQQWLKGDALSDFLEANETVAHRNIVSVDSTVSEHTAAAGAQLTDHITVSGYPEDHGDFKGDKAFGFEADNKFARVSVYWSGSTRNQKYDEAFKPSGADTPQADENHELVGTWTYAAKNGSIKVGGGAPDAYGNPVRIYAKKHGYYVFVYTFTGDSRVAPASSAYNDEWEMVRVYNSPKGTYKHASVTTWASSGTVSANEAFYDNAKVTGNFDDGAYVTFTVYDAVPGNSPDSSARKLLDEVRVPIDPKGCRQAASAEGKSGERTCVVQSPQARTATAGVSYWKATVRNSRGEILASHELGAQHEQVTVDRPGPKVPHKLASTGTGVSAAAAIGILLAAFAVMAVIIGRILYKDSRK